MKKFIESWAIISVLLFGLSGCATFGGEQNPTTTINQELPSGDYITAVVSSKDFVKAQNIASAEAARTECFKSMSATLSSDMAQVAREVRLAAGKGIDCGPGYNDALIAKEIQKTERTKTRWGTGKSIITGGIIGVAGVKAIDTLGEVVSAGLENAGNRTTVDNGSTYNGSQGTNSTFSGIPVNPADVTVSPAGDDEEETEDPITDAESCIAAGGEPVFDEFGNYERCSDGVGGSL